MSALFSTPLTTKRLTLRPALDADLHDLMAVNGDLDVTAFLPYDAWRTTEDGASWLRRMDALATAGSGQQLVIESRATRQVVGTFLLFRFEPAQGRAEVGYVLGQAHWGQGLMKEALHAVCDHAFHAMALRRLEAEVNPANTRSNALLAAVGFKLEGTLRQRWVAKGRAYDTHVYGLLASEWRPGPVVANPAPERAP